MKNRYGLRIRFKTKSLSSWSGGCKQFFNFHHRPIGYIGYKQFLLLHQVSQAPTQTQNKMKSRLLLNVIVRERTTIFQLLACEDQALLVRGDALFVLDLGLHVVNRVGSLHVQGDGLAGQNLHEDLHTSTQAKPM